MGTLQELVEKWGFEFDDGQFTSPFGEIYSTREKEWDGEEYYHEYTFHFCGQTFSESEIIELLEQHKKEQEEQNG